MATEIQDLELAPVQPEPFGPGTTMPAGYVANWTQPGLSDHTSLEWRGADNEATVLTGIDATGIAEGQIRIFSNATISGHDSSSVLLVDESNPVATAGPFASLPANRISTPMGVTYKVDPQGVLVVQRRKNSAGDVRWVVLSGDSRRLWLAVQQFALYPHLQVGTPASPIVGSQDNWNPVGVPYLGNAFNLSVDGGDVADARTFTFWNVYVDAAGARVTGFLSTPGDNLPSDWGPVRFIFNSGPGRMTFGNLDGGSLIENRLVLPASRDYILEPLSGAWFIHPYLDEGLGPTVQWRLMGVSNEVFPSVNTDTRVTTRQLTFTPEADVVLPAGLTSSWNPGNQAVIRVAGTAPFSSVDGLVPIESALVGNELRLIKNVGAVPIVLVPELNSVSPVGERFQLPGPSAFANSSPPLILMPNQEVVLQQGTVPDGGKWKAIGHVQANPTSNYGESITPAVLPVGNVPNYAPVDAVTAVPGRLAAIWRVQGSVGTQLSGIDPAPPGVPPFVHGDRIQLINYLSAFLIMNLGASPPGSQIVCALGGANSPDYTLKSNASVWIIRDGINNQWIIEGPVA